MKKSILIYFLIMVLVLSVGCRSNEQSYPNNTKPHKNEELDLDNWLITDPVSAILDDIYGLQDKITTGDIVYINKFFDPKSGTLTYSVKYNDSNDKKTFVANCEDLFNMGLSEKTENHYVGSYENYNVNVFFYSDIAELKISINQMSQEIVFPFIDNQYPDVLIYDFPENVNPYAAIRGIEYEQKDDYDIIRFNRSWNVNKENQSGFVNYYENIYNEKFKRVKEEESVEQITTQIDNKSNIIIQSKKKEKDKYIVSVTVEYR